MFNDRSEEIRDRFIQDLKQLHQQYHDERGLVYLQYRTNLYLTELLT